MPIDIIQCVRYDVPSVRDLQHLQRSLSAACALNEKLQCPYVRQNNRWTRGCQRFVAVCWLSAHGLVQKNTRLYMSLFHVAPASNNAVHGSGTATRHHGGSLLPLNIRSFNVALQVKSVHSQNATFSDYAMHDVSVFNFLPTNGLVLVLLVQCFQHLGEA